MDSTTQTETHCKMQQKQAHKNMNSWEEFEEDDDVFYAEIRRQVMQLTADDENVDEENNKPNKERGFRNRPSVLQPGVQFNWTGLKDSSRVPQWILDLWRRENGGFSGTGVFIPHIVKSRRRHKPRRKNNERGRVYKPVAN